MRCPHTNAPLTSALCVPIALKKPFPNEFVGPLGGDRVIYTGNVSTKTADLTTAKCLFNSTISTPNGRFMTLDLSDFYLESHLAPADMNTCASLYG